MEKINALTIQERLRWETTISVPWLQLKHDLDYSQAKEMLREMIVRGWVEERPKGNQYQVRHENLKLRLLTPEEREVIIDGCTMDSLVALRHLSDAKGKGLTLPAVVDLVNGVRKTHEALDDLMELKLIYQVGERYYCAIPERSVEVLSRIERQKRFFRVDRNSDDYDRKMGDLRRIYESMFREEEDDE